jgi:ribonuclease P protein component
VAGWALPKGARIRREAEVRRAFDRRASGASGDVVVYAYDRADGRPPRFALVVGRKWGDAVTRNRVRRLLREAFRTSRPELPAGLDLLLLPRGRLERRRMQDVRSMLVRAASGAARKLRATPPAETLPKAPAGGAPPS